MSQPPVYETCATCQNLKLQNSPTCPFCSPPVPAPVQKLCELCAAPVEAESNLCAGCRLRATARNTTTVERWIIAWLVVPGIAGALSLSGPLLFLSISLQMVRFALPNEEVFVRWLMMVFVVGCFGGACGMARGAFSWLVYYDVAPKFAADGSPLCRKCKNTVSPVADACSGCGATNPAQPISPKLRQFQTSVLEPAALGGTGFGYAVWLFLVIYYAYFYTAQIQSAELAAGAIRILLGAGVGAFLGAAFGAWFAAGELFRSKTSDETSIPAPPKERPALEPIGQPATPSPQTVAAPPQSVAPVAPPPVATVSCLCRQCYAAVEASDRFCRNCGVTDPFGPS